MHPKYWMETRPEGLYCKPADLYIDPVRPVKNAVITHGHADHARPGHHTVYATEMTHAIMRIRYGINHAQCYRALEYEEVFQLPNDVELRLIPAGHILGSAQVVLTYWGGKIIISGDYKRSEDPTCIPFKVENCDVFVTEATFGLPVFHHPAIAQEIGKLLHSIHLSPERCHLVGVYALGKCQRLICALREAGYHDRIYLHGALVQLCRFYQSVGCDLGDWIPVSKIKDKSQLKGKIVLAPPSALNDRWSRRLPDVLTIMASGWMQIRARSKQRRAELPMVISDHCDWQELLMTAKEVGAPEVWITHGREDALAWELNKRGFEARSLSLLGYDEDEGANVDKPKSGNSTSETSTPGPSQDQNDNVAKSA